MSAMAIVKLVLQIVLVIFSLLLTLLILMHKGKGGGLSDMFGGGHYRVAVGGHHHRPRFDDEVQPHLKRLHGFGP